LTKELSLPWTCSKLFFRVPSAVAGWRQSRTDSRGSCSSHLIAIRYLRYAWYYQGLMTNHLLQRRIRKNVSVASIQLLVYFCWTQIL
jgi:hypothetical protein